MSAPRTVQRILRSFIAAISGWITAFLVTLPLQAIRILANTGSDAHLFAADLRLGALVWAAWTLSIAGVAWVCGCLPVAVFVPVKWLREHPSKSLALAAAAAWIVVLVRFEIWSLLGPEPYMNFWLFWLYSLFFVAFAITTELVYLRTLAGSRSVDTPSLGPEVALARGSLRPGNKDTLEEDDRRQ